MIFFRDDPNAEKKATIVALIDGASKLILYYYHERFWFQFKTMGSRKRHLVKTITWRAIASLTTFLVAIVVFRDTPDVAQKATSVAFVEIFSKMLIYYIHEEVWYKSNFGLDHLERDSTNEKKKD